MSCSICVENYNKIRREVVCENHECGESCCSSCLLRHTTENNTNCVCMYCNTEFSYERLHESLSKASHDKIRTHQAAMMMSRQKSLLPSTQPLVTERKKLFHMEDTLKTMKFEAKRLRELLNEQNIQIQNLEREMRSIKSGEITLPDTVEEDDENISIGEKCSDGDCKGFLNRARKCMLCSVYSCKDCHESKVSRNDPNHQCDPDTVATIALLKKDTKNCPSCGTPIHKIIGCSQMYCVKCFTAFDWNTMKIVTGVIHNPHYYELQKNGLVNIRNAGDLECGGLPQWYSYSRIIPRDYQTLRNIYVLVNHINDIETARYPLTENNDKFRELRVQYLSDEITEKVWISKLKMENKKLVKSREIRMLFDTLVQCLTSVIQRLVSGPRNPEVFMEAENEINELAQYINEHFVALRGKYNITRIPYINPDFTITYTTK